MRHQVGSRRQPRGELGREIRVLLELLLNRRQRERCGVVVGDVVFSALCQLCWSQLGGFDMLRSCRPSQFYRRGFIRFRCLRGRPWPCSCFRRLRGGRRLRRLRQRCRFGALRVTLGFDALRLRGFGAATRGRSSCATASALRCVLAAAITTMPVVRNKAVIPNTNRVRCIGGSSRAGPAPPRSLVRKRHTGCRSR